VPSIMNLLPYLWDQSENQKVFRASVLASLQNLVGVREIWKSSDGRLWVSEALIIMRLLFGLLPLAQIPISRWHLLEMALICRRSSVTYSKMHSIFGKKQLRMLRQKSKIKNPSQALNTISWVSSPEPLNVSNLEVRI